MKYYIGEVHELNGDLEYDTKYLKAMGVRLTEDDESNDGED